MSAAGPWRRGAILGIVWLAAASLVFALYAPGFPAAWTFDDEYSLRGLARVHDLASAWMFVTSADGTGYGGRPLALASFLINVADWPDNPPGFRQVNVLLHIFNALLVGLLGWRLGRLVPSLAGHAGAFAFTLALVWALHPFLASTTLMAVQRMALLSASFTLLGLLAYLHGRALLPQRPLIAYLWLSGGLGSFAMLGYLSKENGALLPILAGVLEITLLARYAPIAQRYWTAWRWLVLAGPLLALMAYVAWKLPEYQETYRLYRGHSMAERLASQGVILWDYLRQILAPDIGRMGPFQDDSDRLLAVSPATVAIGLGWLLLVAAALVWRRRVPVLAFALLFFLAGHLLESTVIPLELYFEHRNYLAAIAPLAVAHGVLWAVPMQWPRLLSLAMVPIFAFLLWSIADPWGQPRVAAHLWAEAHPTSERAAQYLANMYVQRGDAPAAARAIEVRFRRSPERHSLGVQRLFLSCGVSDAATFRRDLAEVSRAASAPDFGNSMFPDLQKLIVRFAAGGCPHLTIGDLKTLVGAYLDNPVYRHFSASTSALHVRMAMLHEYEGEYESMLDHYRRAIRSQPSPRLTESVVDIFLDLGRRQDAEDFFRTALSALSASALPTQGWQAQMDKVAARLAAGPHAQTQPDPARP